jgi:hypothetical protein
MKLTITQEEAITALRGLGGTAEVWWQVDPRSRVTAYKSAGTGRDAVSMQRRTLESLIAKRLLEVTDAPPSKNGWLVWKLTNLGEMV